MDEASPAGSADWEKILRRVLPLVDVFLPSVEELLFMADGGVQKDCPKSCRTGCDGGDRHPAGCGAAGGENAGVGSEKCLIKCGSMGLYFASCEVEKQRELQTVRDWMRGVGRERGV